MYLNKQVSWGFLEQLRSAENNCTMVRPSALSKQLNLISWIKMMVN